MENLLHFTIACCFRTRSSSKKRHSRQQRPHQLYHYQHHPTSPPPHTPARAAHAPTRHGPQSPQAPCPSTTTTLGIPEASTRVRAPGGTQLKPPPPYLEMVWVEAGHDLRKEYKGTCSFKTNQNSRMHQCPLRSSPERKQSPLYPHPFGWGWRGLCCYISRGSNLGAGLVCVYQGCDWWWGVVAMHDAGGGGRGRWGWR